MVDELLITDIKVKIVQNDIWQMLLIDPPVMIFAPTDVNAIIVIVKGIIIIAFTKANPEREIIIYYYDNYADQSRRDDINIAYSNTILLKTLKG